MLRVLAGMGGVGKTSLARAYAQRHRDDYGAIWWVRAEDPSAIDAEFRTLLEDVLPPGEVDQVRNARRSAFTHLARQTEPWLLVLDNVPDATATDGLLPPKGNGHVLITSRATGWPDPDVVVPVRPLATPAAVELLRRLSLDEDQASATTLADELGGLPLALTQAGSFVRANAIDLATYLRLYRDRGIDLHREDYPVTVATTWQLAMDRLTSTARALLNLLAFYAPDAIPVQRLLTAPDPDELPPLPANELASHRAIGELHAYSLVTVTPAGRGAVTVHRLVQAVTRNSLTEAARQDWANRARILIKAAMPDEPVTATSLASWSALRTHVYALLDHLPPDHADTLATRRGLAEWTGNAGDSARARDLYAHLLPIRERVLGAEHPNTLTTRQNLAYWTGHSGDPARARDLYARLLPISERVLGAEHPDTLAIRYNLAYWTGEVGDPARARDLFAQLLPIRERVQGAEHPNTLITRNEMARWTGYAGDPVRARDLFAQLLPISERVQGAEHPYTLTALDNLAEWTGHAGNPARARDLNAQLLPIRERVLGAEHPDTLTTQQNLAKWTGHAGDPAQARDLLAELLSIRERVLGAEHPNTLITRHRLAYFAGEAGDAIRARDLLAELLPIRERVLGAEHPDTLTTRRNLAHWTEQAARRSG